MFCDILILFKSCYFNIINVIKNNVCNFNIILIFMWGIFCLLLLFMFVGKRRELMLFFCYVYSVFVGVVNVYYLICGE